MKEYREGMSFKYTSLKRDGHFTELRIQDGTTRVFTRGGIEITQKVLWAPWFHAAAAASRKDPAPRTFYGEMWLPGGDASSVKTAYCNRNVMVRFDVFGAGHLPTGCPLVDVRHDAWHCGLEMIPWADTTEKRVAMWPEMMGTPDVEGFVYSDGNMLNQHKWKPMRTCELIITGIKKGSGILAGTVGAIQVSTFEGEEMASVSAGLTYQERAALDHEPEWYIGKVVEIQYQGIGAGGRLRHPVFKYFRPDKPAAECTAEQFS